MLSISARASSFTVSHTDSNNWGSWEISPPRCQKTHAKSLPLRHVLKTQTNIRCVLLTVQSLNLQHRNECGEDFGFGPFHQLLVSLQDTLQDKGEGRQDVRS